MHFVHIFRVNTCGLRYYPQVVFISAAEYNIPFTGDYISIYKPKEIKYNDRKGYHQTSERM